MSFQKRTTEEKIKEFRLIISKLKRREDRLIKRLFKGGSNMAFDIPVSVSGLRKLREVFEAALWVVQNPDGKWNSDVFQAKNDLQNFAVSIKDLIDTAMETKPLDRGIDRLLGTYLRAVNDAYEEMHKYTERHLEDLKRRVDEEFPPDPEKKGTTYWRKRKDELPDLPSRLQ